jgi:hypothetical protein
MIQKLLGTVLVLSTVMFAGASSAQEQPNLDWEGNWGFGNGAAGQRDQAYLIEFQKKGGFRTNITNNSTTICEADGGCVSNIENQVSNTSIGSMNSTDNSNVIHGDNNTATNTTDSTSTNSGAVTGTAEQNSVDTVNVEVPVMFESDYQGSPR